jgi:hypothetical protein
MVQRISKADGSVVDVAGVLNAGYADGTGTDAWFDTITGLATDGANLWVVDHNNRLRVINGSNALSWLAVRRARVRRGVAGLRRRTRRSRRARASWIRRAARRWPATSTWRFRVGVRV